LRAADLRVESLCINSQIRVNNTQLRGIEGQISRNLTGSD
jgi:hypothetical protein